MTRISYLLPLLALGIAKYDAIKCRRAPNVQPINPDNPNDPGTLPLPPDNGSYGQPGGLNMYGFGYNAKHADGSCPTLQKVVDDFKILKKNVGSIRTFGLNDCKQGALLIEASKQTGLQLNLGLFVNFNQAEFDSEFATLKTLISSYKDTFIKNVPSIIVGSETLYRKERTPKQLAEHINAVKKSLQDLKMNIKVTTADTKDMWAPNEVLDAVDYMMVNAYPYWESIPVEKAVDHLFVKIKEVKDRTKSANKLFVLGETGWPAGGDLMGPAIPSPQNQMIYYKGFVCRARREALPYYYFAAFDEYWNANETKSAWGVLKTDGTPKNNYQVPLKC